MIEDKDPTNLQTLTLDIWSAQIPKYFKPLLLMLFNGKSVPHEHVISIKIHMAIIGVEDFLMVRMFKEGVIRLYTSLPRSSVSSYQDLTRKIVHHYSANKHIKVSTISLFNFWQGHSKSLRECFARFNEETIRSSTQIRRCSLELSKTVLRPRTSTNPWSKKYETLMENYMARA